jgi:BASS family bile acid:Na+ symporter
MLVAGVALGLAWQSAAGVLRTALSPLVFMLMVGALLGIDGAALLARLRRPLLLVCMIVWILVGAPAIVAAAVRLLGLPAGLAQAMVLWSASSPLISSAPLAMLIGLDGALALIATVLATMAVPFTLPIVARLAFGTAITIAPAALATRLGILAFGSAATAAVLKPLLRRSGLAPGPVEINGLNVLLLFLFSVGVMGGAQQLIAARPAAALAYVGIAFAESAVLFAATALAFAGFGRTTALSVALASCFSNLALVWAALGDAAGADFLLFFLAVQFPIYLLPVALRVIVRSRFVTPSPTAAARQSGGTPR